MDQAGNPSGVGGAKIRAFFIQKRGAGTSRFVHYPRPIPVMRPPASKAKAPARLPSALRLGRHLGRLYESGLRTYRGKRAACGRAMSRHAVHQARVAIRRLLAGLELLGALPGKPPEVRKLLRRELKTLGELRNVQIQLQRIDDEPQLTAVLEPLRRHLRKREQRREKAARKALKSTKAMQRLKRWARPPAPEDHRLLPRLRRLMDIKLQRAFDPMAAFSPSTPADSAVRHRARVLSREYRYMAEALRPRWRGCEPRRFVTNLQAYQEIIGQIHDRELLLHRIDRSVADGRIQAASIRAFCNRLHSEKTKLLKACAQLDRWMLHEAMLARRHLRQHPPSNSTTA